jgi:hypothetical protein
LNIPEKYNRFSNETAFPEIVIPNIIINRCKDYGPATKLLGLYGTDIYNNLCDKDIIIVVDDDRDYNSRMIEGMINYHNQYPDDALTVAGWDVEALTNNKIQYCKKVQHRGIEFERFGNIDILGGCCGFLLTKAICPFNWNEIFTLLPDDPKYYVDDVWFSGFLTLNEVNIYIIPNMINKDEAHNVNNSICPLSDNTREYKNTLCINYFRDKYGIWK